MKVAVEGCAHGELEKIYDSIAFLEAKNNIKVDLLLCCGDFQATRNTGDLDCMAVPPKYRYMCTFYKYYSGEKTAPILTILIGGNHEASNYFQELGYGGWVAPNIYYLGYAGVVQVGGVRIGGISGIFKPRDYYKGRFEMVPYSKETKRSCYHTRALDVFRLKQISKPLHVMMSHDWPQGVYNHGNISALLMKKPFFKEEVESNTLGSQPAAELLAVLQPDHWFSAHLHVKFSALVKHDNGAFTRFLALDKCLPRRQFLQVVDIPHEGEIDLSYDLEWLAVLQLTDHLTSIRCTSSYMPGPGCGKRWIFTPTEEETETVRKMLGNDLKIPKNFVKTAPSYDPSGPAVRPYLQPNPQTAAFCNLVGVDDPLVLLLRQTPGKIEPSPNQSKLNYSSFQTSNTEIDSSWSTPVKHPTLTTRTPLQLPAPRASLLSPVSGSSPATELTLSTPLPQPNLPPTFSTPYICSSLSVDLNSSTPSPASESTLPSTLSSSTPLRVASPLSGSIGESPAAPHISPDSQFDIPPDKKDENTDSPGPKRFRRRNLAMYASATEDE